MREYKQTVSRETHKGTIAKMSSYSDTPIAEAAERASRIIHRMDLDDLPRPAFRRMFSVANQKGGVGKTTSAVNLAAALGLYGMRVLVVDLDPQGNASTALGAEHRSGTPSSYELLLGDCKLEECVQQSTAGENVFVVPATIDLAGSEIELVGMVARENRLKDALNDEYLDELDIDFVFIDCPPSLGLLTINSMVAADEILLPIQCVNTTHWKVWGSSSTTSISFRCTSIRICIFPRFC